MSGDLITSLLLPAGLMFIMFSLGLGLTPVDFRRVVEQPRAFAIGVVAHFFVLPLTAYLLVQVFGIGGALAVGCMIIAACPTGTTSNLLTAYARGDVALAVSFTAFAALVSIVSVPLVVTAALQAFMGSDQPLSLPVSQVMRHVFLIIGLPVAAGMLLRHVFPERIRPIERPVAAIAGGVFVLTFVASIVKHWELFQQHFPTLGPMLLSLNVLMLIAGFALARFAGVPRDQAVTVAIESSVQNGTLAIVIGSTLLRNDTMVLPAAIYSVVMCVNGLLFVVVSRRLLRIPVARRLA